MNVLFSLCTFFYILIIKFFYFTALILFMIIFGILRSFCLYTFLFDRIIVMKLEYLYYIVEVNQCRSISKAAKKLYITQPTLSVGLSNLENELGYPLFVRTRNGVTPTVAGMKIIESAQEIIIKMNELQQLSERIDDNKKIKIYAVPEICNSFLIDLIELIQNKKLDICLELRENRTSELLTHITNRDSNIAIGCFTTESKAKILSTLKDSQLSYDEILHDKFVVFISKKDELSYNNVIYSDDLKDRKAVLFDDSELLSADNIKTVKKANHNYYFNDKSSIKKAVYRNLGYAVLPGLMAIDDIYVETDSIRIKPLADSNTVLTSILIYDKAKLSKKEKQVISLIKQLAKITQEKIDSIETIESIDGEKTSNTNINIYY